MSNIFRKIKNSIIPWWTPSRKSQKELKEKAKKLLGYDLRKNKSWNKSYGYFIKRQCPWYGLFESIIYQIEVEKDYIINKSWLAKEEVDKQVKQMNEALELGYKILEDNYEEYARAWNRYNSVSITKVYLRAGKEEIGKHLWLPKHGEEVAVLYDQNLVSEILEEQNDQQSDDRFNDDYASWKAYMKDKDTRSIKQFIADYNRSIDEMNTNLDKKHKLKLLTKKDICTVYSSEWTNGKSDKENHDTFLKLYKDAWKAKQKDKDKFFKLVSKYYEGWGD